MLEAPKHITADDKIHAIVIAQRMERETGEYRYVIHTHDDRWLVSDRMPYGGVEWYDTGGIRHG